MTLFETSNQPLVLFFCVLFGFLAGLFFDLGGVLCFLCKKNKVVQIVCDLFSTLLCFFVAFCICYKLNFGQFRLYIPLVFFTFVYLERITIGKLVAKAYLKCYNVFEKIIQTISKVIHKNKKNGTTKEK